MTEIDTSAEAVERRITELLGWLTGPDSGQNDGIMETVTMLRALAAERDAARAEAARFPLPRRSGRSRSTGEPDVTASTHTNKETDMINIDNLTIAQAREIAALFGAQTKPAEAPHPFVGRYVILRCYSAGVHAGWLVSQTGDQAVLRDSRRLWRWHAAGGIALSGCAVHGIIASKSKLDATAPEIALTGVIETIPCSDVARESIVNG